MEKKLQKTISYESPFIVSVRFMAGLLSNLVGNLAEVVHKIKCKHGHIIKNVKRVELNTKIVSGILNRIRLGMI